MHTHTQHTHAHTQPGSAACCGALTALTTPGSTGERGKEEREGASVEKKARLSEKWLLRKRH